MGTILDEIENNIHKLYLKAKNSNNITDIQAMNNALKSISIEYDIELLKEYTERLYNAIDTFDIITMKNMLNEYESIIKRLAQ